jgi:hypothetical protein
LSNVIQFPNSKITVMETIEDVLAAAKEGKIKHVMIISIGDDTNVWTAMSTMSAYWAVYLTWYADKAVQKLMKEGGLL